MRKLFLRTRYTILLVLLCPHVTTEAQTAESKPRLFVEIYVDGLSEFELTQFSSNYRDGGFAEILEKSSRLPYVQTDYYSSNAVADIMAINTGAAALKSNVSAPFKYNKESGELQSVFFDASIPSLDPTLKLSPASIDVTTIGDELRMHYGKTSKVYGIGFTPEQAIALGGHNTNPCFWIDDKSGAWTTSPFYQQGTPSWVNEINNQDLASEYMTREWNALLDQSRYTFFQQSEVKRGMTPIDYSEYSEAHFKFRQLKKSPFANTLACDFAKALIEHEELGKDHTPDLLGIQLSVADHYGKENGNLSLEKEDLYLRLDRDLADLIKYLKDSVGEDRFAIMLTGSGSAPVSKVFGEKNGYHIPTFNQGKITALLNIYLMVIYGQENWIKGYHNHQIYLDHKKMEETKTNKEELIADAARFCAEFESVESCLPTANISKRMALTSENKQYINSMPESQMGDLYLIFRTGVVDESLGYRTTQGRHFMPTYFYGWRFYDAEITRPSSISELAPTVCRILGIPTPNASEGQAIPKLLEIVR